MSAARSTTVWSEVTMQPKPTAVGFSPVLPIVRYANFGAVSFGRVLGGRVLGVLVCRLPSSAWAAGRANPTAGNASPAVARKLRRDAELLILNSRSLIIKSNFNFIPGGI